MDGNAFSWRVANRWTGFAVAVLVVALLALFRRALNAFLGDSSPFLLYTFGVLVAAFYGGLWPGLLATFLSALSADNRVIEPLFTFQLVRREEMLNAVVFLGVGTAISALVWQWRKARETALTANQAKDRFLAILSHELRNPLNPVMVAASVLRKDSRLPVDVREDLEMIRRNVALEARLIDDLLDVQRIEHGKLHIEKRVVDVHVLLTDAIAICRGDFQSRRLALKVDLRAGSHRVRGDSVRLQQVFWNLLKNAAKFTPESGWVRVRTENDHGQIRVMVQDSGSGIDPADLKRVFQPFEQAVMAAGADHASARGRTGLGLGLSICQALIEQHAGKIWAESAGRGRGSTFIVQLPVTAKALQAAATTEPAAPGPPSGRRLRILLVEDHADTVALMSKLLMRVGYEVESASAMRPALAVAAARPIDLVVSDLGLPDGSGLDLMRILKRRYNLKGVCLSGHGTDEDIQRSAEAGFVEHLVKPVDMSRLVVAIRRATGETEGLEISSSGVMDPSGLAGHIERERGEK